MGARKEPTEEMPPRDDTAHDKNLDTMKLLVSYDEFQKIVTDARAYLMMPLDDLAGDADSIRKWSELNSERQEEMRQAPSFRAALKSMHNRRESGEITKEEYKRESRALHYQLPSNYLTWTIDFIIENFNLPKNFAYNLREYILIGKVSAPWQNFAIVTRTGIDEEEYEAVEVYAKLSKAEMESMKWHLENRLRERQPELRKIKNIDRAIEIEKWVKDRTRYDPVEQESYKMSNVEIAENLVGKKDGKIVYDVVTGLEVLRHSRFEKHKENDSEMNP